MATRRGFLVGLGNVAAGSAAVSAGAFNGVASPSADMRVIADTQCPRPGIRLVPARDEPFYVKTDSDGTVTEITFSPQESNGEGLTQSAESRFERLIGIENAASNPPIEDLYLDFEVTDTGLGPEDPTLAEIESTLFVTTDGSDMPGTGSQDLLSVTTHPSVTDGTLPDGETVPFGIGVDLLPSSTLQALPDPTKFEVILEISASAEGLPTCGEPAGPDITGVLWRGGQITAIQSPEDTSITVDVWYFDETTGNPSSGGGPPGEGNGPTDDPVEDFSVACSVDAETNTPLQSFLTGPASNSHVAVYIHETNESWHHPDFDPALGQTDDWTQNADGVNWGSGSIASAFDVECQ